MKKLTYLLFFISETQKKKISSAVEEKVMQNGKKNWKKWKARLVRKTCPARTLA